jgi:hypothetical protein
MYYRFSHIIDSYDTRGNHAGTPSHWKDEEILENRAIFRTVRSPAELVIKPVKVRESLQIVFKFRKLKFRNIGKGCRKFSMSGGFQTITNSK